MMRPDVYVYQQNMQQTDKDELFVCPFDPVHRITAKRFVRHILKCKKNHPKSDKKVCPFNARHIIPKPELQMHISTCPDKRLLENEINCERMAFEQAELRGDNSIPPYVSMEDLDFGTNEDWEEEIQQSMQEVNTANTRKEEIHQHLQESQRLNARVPTTERRPLQDRPAFGIGRGKNLQKYADNNSEQIRPNHRPTSGIQLAANFSRKPITQSCVENGIGLGRRPRTGPNHVPQKADHVIVSREADKEISVTLEAMTQHTMSTESSATSSSESVEEPGMALRKEKKRLLKLLKQISLLEKQVTSGTELNLDERAKLGRKPLTETRLFEIDLELGED